VDDLLQRCRDAESMDFSRRRRGGLGIVAYNAALNTFCELGCVLQGLGFAPGWAACDLAKRRLGHHRLQRRANTFCELGCACCAGVHRLCFLRGLPAGIRSAQLRHGCQSACTGLLLWQTIQQLTTSMPP
jgi:hypothetical protein